MPAQHVPFCTSCARVTDNLDAPFLVLSDPSIPATDWRPPPAAVVCPLAVGPADNTGPGIPKPLYATLILRGLKPRCAGLASYDLGRPCNPPYRHSCRSYVPWPSGQSCHQPSADGLWRSALI
jgi:hypothetical protein